MTTVSRFLLAAIFLIASTFAQAQVEITVTNPPDDVTIVQPFAISAFAESSVPMAGWKIYVDGVTRWHAGNNSFIIAAAIDNLSKGEHRVVVRGWNILGQHGSAELKLRVYNDVTPPERVHVYTPLAPLNYSGPIRVLAVAETDQFANLMLVYIDGVERARVDVPFVDRVFDLSIGSHTITVQYRTATGAWIKETFTFNVQP
jgi:hypothetical protein